MFKDFLTSFNFIFIFPTFFRFSFSTTNKKKILVNFSWNYHKQETIESEFHAFIASEKGAAGSGGGGGAVSSINQATAGGEAPPPEYKTMTMRQSPGSTTDPSENPVQRQVPYETAIDEIEILETSFGVSWHFEENSQNVGCRSLCTWTVNCDWFPVFCVFSVFLILIWVTCDLCVFCWNPNNPFV